MLLLKPYSEPSFRPSPSSVFRAGPPMGDLSRFGYNAGQSLGLMSRFRAEGRMEKKARQHIRYLRTPDGVKLAWATAGSGPVFIKAANWLTHLEYEWESPVWRHWIHFFSERFRFVRYDERGCGMTDWNVGDLSFQRWVEDLESVIEATE